MFAGASDSQITNKIRKQFLRRQKQQAITESKVNAAHKKWDEKLHRFLEANSRVMPNKRDTILMFGKRVAKRHLLLPKYKAYKAENPLYKFGYTTFKKQIPKNVLRLKMSHRRVCICVKDYNLEQKVQGLNHLCCKAQNPVLSATVHELSNLSMCKFTKFPQRKCVDRICDHCGVEKVKAHYQPVLDYAAQHPDQPNPTWWIWEQAAHQYTNRKGDVKDTTIWKQIKKSSSASELRDQITEELKDHSAHIFRAAYQQDMESTMMSPDTLPT